MASGSKRRASSPYQGREALGKRVRTSLGSSDLEEPEAIASIMLYIYVKKQPDPTYLPDPINVDITNKFIELYSVAQKYNFVERGIIYWGLEDGQIYTNLAIEENIQMLVNFAFGDSHKISGRWLRKDAARWVLAAIKKPVLKKQMETLVVKFPHLGLQLVSVQMQQLEHLKAAIEGKVADEG